MFDQFLLLYKIEVAEIIEGVMLSLRGPDNDHQHTCAIQRVTSSGFNCSKIRFQTNSSDGNKKNRIEHRRIQLKQDFIKEKLAQERKGTVNTTKK